MADPIEDFERDCASAGFAPAAVLREAGLNSSTWFRWRSGAVSPTLRSFEAARQALVRMSCGSHDLAPVLDGEAMAPGSNDGAEKSDANISRTGDAA